MRNPLVRPDLGLALTALLLIVACSKIPPPEANHDGYTTAEDAALVVDAASGVLSNDMDSQGGELRALLVSAASHGALVLSADGSFIYTPNQSFNGIDQFTYRLKVGKRISTVARVWLVVSPRNHAPVAADDAYLSLSNTPLIVHAAIGIVANDTDADQDPLQVVLVGDVSHGALLLKPDGSFLYDPADGFTGYDAFLYRANDTLLDSNIAIVLLKVNAPVPAPVATDDAYTTPADTALTVDAASGVLSNDLDSEGDPLLAQPMSPTSDGTLSLNPDGSFLYVPNDGYSGTDQFTYRTVAGTRGSQIATVTISVRSNESPPRIVTGNVSFFKQVVDDTLGEIHAVAAADFTGDGEIDLVATDFVDGMVFWYENDGTGGFITRVLDADLLGAYPVGVGDVDGDGDPDVMAAGFLSDTFRWYESDGAGGFTPHDIDTAADGAHSIVTGDVDGDGDVDLLTSSQTANNIAWYENDGANNYTRHIIDANAMRAKRAELADVDGDGDMDVVAASFDDNTIAWHENDGSENFTKHIISDSERGAYYAFPIDIDGDGDTDVFSASKNDASIRWHRNDGPMGFTTLSIAEGATGARSVIAADINGDGAPDALAGIVDKNTFAWYANDGDGGFANGFVDTDAAGAYGTFAIDMNHDGRLDVVSASRDANELAVHIQGRDHLITVDRGDTLTFDSSLLRAEDADNGPAELVYTLGTPPSLGLLSVNGNPLGVGGTFTQADIDGGHLSYEHDGIDASSDAFEFEVSDGDESAYGSFSINIAEFTGTIVQLPLDDGSGVTAEDISGNGLDGTLVNGPVFEANTGDDSAFALRLDGSDDFIDLGVLDVDGTGLTLSAWFNADKFPGNSKDPRLISKASGIAANDHVFMLGTIEVGSLVRLRARVRHGGVTTTLIASSGNLLTGVWYHAAVTDDGSVMRLYLDGIEVGSVPAGGAVDLAPSIAVAVGAQPPGAGSNYFDGLVDDVRILSLPMTQAEIVEISSGANRAPTAQDDFYGTAENADLTVSAESGVLANDDDPDGDPIEARLLTNVGLGTLVLAGDGSFSYSPAPGAFGIDSFSYEAFDGRSASNVATVMIDVMAVENAPVANADGYSTNESTTLVISPASGILSNDFDPEGLVLSALLQTDVQNGSLDLAADGSFTYIPDSGFSGDDFFIYTASDGGLSSAPTTVTITVANPPIARDDAYGTDEDVDLIVSAEMGVLENDTSPQPAPLTAELVTGPSSGSVVLGVDGSFTYSPAPDFSGPDSFTYFVSDGTRQSNIATVSIGVVELNDAPIALFDAYEIEPGASLDVAAASGVLANDQDPEGTALSAVLVDDVVDGSLSLLTDGSFSYFPNPGFMGSDSFTYRADDGALTSALASVTITVANSLSVGLVAHWPMDTGSGTTAIDATGNGHDGILIDPIWTTSTADGSEAALEFDGLDDFVDVGPIEIVGQALSIAAWVNLDDFATNDQRILSMATGVSEQQHYWMISTTKSGGFRLRARLKVAGSTRTIVANETISANVWIHVALTFDGSSIRLYQDGVEVGNLAQTGDLDVDPNVSLALGNQPVGAGEKALAGRLDDVRIYERALSLAEAATLANTPPAQDTTPPAPPAEVFAVPLSTSSAEISWSDANDDEAMGTYTLLRGGTAIASNLILPQYVDSGLMSATTYDYTVIAIDAAGNTSSVSVLDRIVTLAVGAPVWFDPAFAYRIPIDVDANGSVRVGRYLELTLDFTTALASVGQTAALDTNSLRVTRSNTSGQVLQSNVAFQFDPAGDFDATTNAVGELVVLMEGTAASSDVRRYDLYFDVVGEGFTPVPVVDRLAVLDVVDEGQDALLIETATSSYFFHEQGASLSGLVDSDDNDWISYRVGGGSAGEFRGIPNLIYPEGEFHPGGTGGSTLIQSQGPLRLRLKTAALAGAWQATWSFYDDHASMTVEQVDHAYWFLYEGTPGGVLEEGFDFVTRSDGTQTLLDQSWVQDIEAEEWVYFGDPGLERSLFLASHSDDTAADSYQTLNGEMTVFGFGRSGTNPLMNAVPRTFSIGLIESTNYEVNARRIRSIVQDLVVAVGSIQEAPPQ